jgi:hypothetical protein
MSYTRNAESYSRLVDICTGLGGNYNPGHQPLQLKAMRALLTEAQSSLQDVLQKKEAYHRILNERSATFDGLPVLANSVIGILEAIQVPMATIEDARYYYRLIAGRRATSRPPVTSEEKDDQSPMTRGVGQLSFADKASNFLSLAKTLQALPAYTSNEPELKVPALIAKAAVLQQLNRKVYEAKIAMSAARLQRDRLFYRQNTGVVDVAKASKRYIKAVFGTRSGEAIRLRDCPFTKQKVR